MSKTSWPFVEWTEILGEKDSEELRVREAVIGDDVRGNMGVITKVKIFSSLLKPRSLSIKGDKIRWILAENRDEELLLSCIV